MELPTAVTEFLDSSLEYIYSFEPIAAKTVVLVPDVLREQLASLADSIGFDVESLTFALGLLICYPLGMIMNMVPHGKMRHMLSFILGAFLCQFTVGVQWVHQLITSLVVYAMFLVLPRKTASQVVPTFVMLYCVMGHLHRQYVNYLGWDLDFTGAQMVLTQKLYMMAYNLYDGELIAKGKESRAAKKCAPFALKELPGIVEFLGYTFCFSNVLSGPSFEFVTYNNACEGSHMYTADGKPRGNIPSSFWPSLKCLLKSFAALGVFVVIGPYFPILDPNDPKGTLPVILQPEFLLKPWHIRYAYMWMGLFVGVRPKYYFAWLNAEGANNVWYAGFEGFDDLGKAKGWGNANNMDIWKFETAPDVQTLAKEWNKKTSTWLTRYVYMRSGGSLVAVYSMSAFWHGFYPGYYLFFLSVPLVTFCDRLAKKKISPYFSSEKWSLYGIVSIFATSLVMEYMVSPFVLLAMDRAWSNWTSHYFFGHVLCIAFYMILSMMPTPKKKAA